MTTINTPEDLLNLLERDQVFRNAVRHHILGEELLQLPQRFAEFVAQMTEFIAAQEQHNRHTDEAIAKIAEFIAAQQEHNRRTDETIAELRADVTEIRASQQRVETSIDELRAANRRVETFMDEQRDTNRRVETFMDEQRDTNRRVETFMDEQRDTNRRVETAMDEQRDTNRRVETAIGELRGNVARGVTLGQIDNIFEEFNIEYLGLFERQQRIDLLRNVSRDVISMGDRRSFYRADLIIHGRDRDGVEVFLAIEASYTADIRDTNRAMRNADYLNTYTGIRAMPAIASVSLDHAARDLVIRGDISWFQLDPAEFTPE